MKNYKVVYFVKKGCTPGRERMETQIVEAETAKEACQIVVKDCKQKNYNAFRPTAKAVEYTMQYAPGWDIGRLWEAIINDAQDKNKVYLQIGLKKCEQDIEKLTKSITLLEAGEDIDRAWIPAYRRTIEELEKAKVYCADQINK